jgi:hypothetical protein
MVGYGASAFALRASAGAPNPPYACYDAALPKVVKRHSRLGCVDDGGSLFVLNDREKVLSALREKPLKVYEVMKRANIPNEEACQSLLLKMRDEGSVKFDIHKGRWLIA